MLNIQLKGEAEQLLEATDVTYIRCVGRYMYAGPDDRVIGKHTMGLWEVGAQSFVSIRVTGPLVASFQGAEETRVEFGPYAGLQFTEGYMKVGENFQEAVAHFRDVPERWTLLESGEEKAILLIRPAAKAD